VHEPRATLIIRTGIEEATVYRVPHAERLLISLAPHGLKVDTTNKVDVSSYSEPRAIPGHDTAPMLLRGESFRQQDEHTCSNKTSLQSVVKDLAGAVSPWNSLVYIKNSTATPVTVLLARDPTKPSHVDASHYEVPANETLTISSGYVHEPRATLIIRTGVGEANTYRVPHAERLLISLAPHGLKVDATDKVEVLSYSEPTAIPGHDTAPMLLRGESFSKRVETSIISEQEPSGVLLGRMQPIPSEPKSHPEAHTVGKIGQEIV